MRRLRPLVGIVSSAPLLAEGVARTLEGVADTRSLSSKLGDLTSLLHSLSPDVIVVDREIAEVDTYAQEFDIRVIAAPVEVRGAESPSPEGLRALVVGATSQRAGRA